METEMTLKMMWSDDRPLFDVDINEFSFMQEYINKYTLIDTNIITLYGSRRIVLPKSKTFSQLFNGFLTMQKEPFTRFYNSISMDFSPIENYDKTSDITTNFVGSEKVTENYGDQKSVTTTGGTQNNTIGASTTNSLNSVSPYDSTEFFNKENNVTNTQEQVNTSKSDITDTLVTNSHSDSTEKAFTDRKNIVTEHTHGNIGVTKSTELLIDYQNMQKKMNFILEIIGIFLHMYTY